MPRDRSTYTDRINRVADYVASHLEDDLSLEVLARVACFSPWHFHRIFRAVAGETLKHHVRRVRLERAAQLLRASPKSRITDIALQVGYRALPEFSRDFKAHFGLNAGAWDRRSELSEDRKNPQARVTHGEYSDEELRAWSRESRNQARVLDLPACRFVYHRIHDSYAEGAFKRGYEHFMSWVRRRDLDLSRILLAGMSQDDPEITPLARCRYDIGLLVPTGAAAGVLRAIESRRGSRLAAISIPAEPELDRFEFGIREVPSCRVAAIHIEGDATQFDRAWQFLFKLWLPASRYQPANVPAMELYGRAPDEIGWDHWDLECCIPVETLC